MSVLLSSGYEFTMSLLQVRHLTKSYGDTYFPHDIRDVPVHQPQVGWLEARVMDSEQVAKDFVQLDLRLACSLLHFARQSGYNSHEGVEPCKQ